MIVVLDKIVHPSDGIKRQRTRERYSCSLYPSMMYPGNGLGEKYEAYVEGTVVSFYRKYPDSYFLFFQGVIDEI